MHDAKVPSVSFTGGERTLVPELPDLIRHAKNLGMRVNLITNGTRVTADLAADLAGAGLDSAQVSLEGVTPATHDAMVGVPGSFEKTLAAVRALHRTGIHTHTNTTITRANLDECVQFPRFVRDELDLDRFSMNLIIPTGSVPSNHELIVRYNEIGPVLERLIAESERWETEFMWYSPVPMCLFNSIPHGLGNKGCGACDGLISVAPNGDVLPCASFDDSVGNLLTQGFEAVWQGEKARRYRDKGLAPAGCRDCEDFHICNGACPLYWREMGCAELPPRTRDGH